MLWGIVGITIIPHSPSLWVPHLSLPLPEETQLAFVIHALRIPCAPLAEQSIVQSPVGCGQKLCTYLCPVLWHFALFRGFFLFVCVVRKRPFFSPLRRCKMWTPGTVFHFSLPTVQWESKCAGEYLNYYAAWLFQKSGDHPDPVYQLLKKHSPSKNKTPRPNQKLKTIQKSGSPQM